MADDTQSFFLIFIVVITCNDCLKYYAGVGTDRAVMRGTIYGLQLSSLRRGESDMLNLFSFASSTI